MEFLSAEMFSTLLSIIIIDLVLAGDNALVIGLASRNLPKQQQKKAIIWGTAGAIMIRAIATIFVVWLLKVPGLHAIGGVILIWIAYKLLIGENEEENIESSSSLIGAIRTIIVADVMMGLDNVLAIAGAAKGHTGLVIIGLLISVPLVVWGSQMIVKLLDRFPLLIYVGGGVLAFTATRMILEETFIKNLLDDNPVMYWVIVAIMVVGVLVAGKLKKDKQSTTAASV
ncbi:YjbE family integral membrane protein [Aneurinibacillus soli]|uniref:Integral membrane protein TerC family protein n=1 Tax=Aneurinibacillus soli TaxID=1500254 RepID=A0A0U4WM08_9BACL|nr:TerC family protein [Aneurinibacillus soli]PYE59875.1 YjbE family integral membrane protein [Aneurinibacillus soli]BAU29403.1 Integral membrane protein TerC family protein [Aneurinibacillus soli]